MDKYIVADVADKDTTYLHIDNCNDLQYYVKDKDLLPELFIGNYLDAVKELERSKRVDANVYIMYGGSVQEHIYEIQKYNEIKT